MVEPIAILQISSSIVKFHLSSDAAGHAVVLNRCARFLRELLGGQGVFHSAKSGMMNVASKKIIHSDMLPRVWQSLQASAELDGSHALYHSPFLGTSVSIYLE
jgi:hypothetical protein